MPHLALLKSLRLATLAIPLNTTLGPSCLTTDRCSALQRADDVVGGVTTEHAIVATTDMSIGNDVPHTQPISAPVQPPPIVMLTSPTTTVSQSTGSVTLTIASTSLRPVATPKSAPTKTSQARRQRKKKDPNAPAAVSSAYAFFFKETQASVKTHNPGAKFGEVSKIVATMWEVLPEEEKAVYRQKNEEDKRRHEREMAEYRAKLEESMAGNGDQHEDEEESDVDDSKGRNNRLSQQQPVPSSQTQSVTSGSANVTPAGSQPLFNATECSDKGGSRCIRAGCDQPAVKNVEWEDEYCSNECVVMHCGNVFAEWVLAKTTIVKAK